jgi:hypothetical protein
LTRPAVHVQAVKRAPLEFPSPGWDEISQEAKVLLRDCMLTRDPTKRLTAEHLLVHPWCAAAAATVAFLVVFLAGISLCNMPELSRFLGHGIEERHGPAPGFRASRPTRRSP